MNALPPEPWPHRGLRSLCSPTPPESNPGVAMAGPKVGHGLVSTKYSVVLDYLRPGEVGARRETGAPEARNALLFRLNLMARR